MAKRAISAGQQTISAGGRECFHGRGSVRRPGGNQHFKRQLAESPVESTTQARRVQDNRSGGRGKSSTNEAQLTRARWRVGLVIRGGSLVVGKYPRSVQHTGGDRGQGSDSAVSMICHLDQCGQSTSPFTPGLGSRGDIKVSAIPSAGWRRDFWTTHALSPRDAIHRQPGSFGGAGPLGGSAVVADTHNSNRQS